MYLSFAWSTFAAWSYLVVSVSCIICILVLKVYVFVFANFLIFYQIFFSARRAGRELWKGKRQKKIEKEKKEKRELWKTKAAWPKNEQPKLSHKPKRLDIPGKRDEKRKSDTNERAHTRQRHEGRGWQYAENAGYAHGHETKKGNRNAHRRQERKATPS